MDKVDWLIDSLTKEITVGKVSTNADTKSFDGMQPYWDGIPRQISSWRVDMSEMILADKPIPAVLARTIMSSNGSDSAPVTAIVERNVYAEQGRNIVIPAGSRVMGTSSGGSSGGNSGGGNSSGTGTAGGTQGVVYMDNEADNVQPTTPLIDDSASSNNKKRRAAAPAIPPVTSVGATPPPSSTAGSTNTSAQLF